MDDRVHAQVLMKLVELHGCFVRKHEDGTTPFECGVSFAEACGVKFDCPATRGHLHFVPFEGRGIGDGWNVSGTSLDDLTLTPSILFHPRTCRAMDEDCPGWHGFITNGEVRTV